MKAYEIPLDVPVSELCPQIIWNEGAIKNIEWTPGRIVIDGVLPGYVEIPLEVTT